jgi:DUF971 family protein
MLNTFSPKKINLRTESNLLHLEWQNGEYDELSGRQLRQYCACSTCRAKNHVGFELIGDNNQIQSIKLMGSTGLQIIFADGHDRGVFPWGYLRAIAKDEAIAFLDAS